MPTIQRQTPTLRPAAKPGYNGASALDLIDSLRVIVYGQSGTGKTTFWATFPGTTLALICSGGNKPGELRSINTPENRKRIKPVVIANTDLLRTNLEEGAGFDNVVLDHISGLQDLVLKEILGLEEIPAQKGWGLASQQQYGQCTLQCKEYCRALLNLPGNVVIVGQERTFGGKDEGGDPELIKPTIGPSVTPSLCGWLLPAADYTLQTFKRPVIITSKGNIGGKEVTTTKRGKGVEYCARTEPHETFMTKFRLPKEIAHLLPAVIVNPTYQKVLDVIAGKYKE